MTIIFWLIFGFLIYKDKINLKDKIMLYVFIGITLLCMVVDIILNI